MAFSREFLDTLATIALATALIAASPILLAFLVVLFESKYQRDKPSDSLYPFGF